MLTRSLCIVFSLSTLLAGAAGAADSFDLRKLLDRQSPVGEKIRTTEDETKKQVMGPQAEEERTTATFVDEVQAVGADGEPTRTLRTYEAFRAPSGEDVKVDGVQVVITRDEQTNKKSFDTPEGAPQIPPAVFDAIAEDLENDNERAAKGFTDKMLGEVMLPAEPKAVNDTWTIDVAKMVEMIGFEAADVDLTKSSAQGAVDGSEQKDGRTWVSFHVEMKLVLVRMPGSGGQRLPKPSPMDTTMRFHLPAAADGPDGDSHMVQHVELNVPGPQGKPMAVTIDTDKTERRSLVR